MVHDRVAHHDHFKNFVWSDIGFVGQIVNQVIDCIANDCGEFLFAAFVHHHVRHATHEVFAEADLWVHYSRTTHHFACCEIDQVSCNCCRPNVDRNSKHRFHEPRPSSDDIARNTINFGALNRNGRATVTFINRPVHLGKCIVADGRTCNVVLLGDCVANDLRCSDIVSKLRRRYSDVEEAERWVDNDYTQVQVFAHNLTVHLAHCRNVDDHVAAHFGHTTETITFCECALTLVFDFTLRTLTQ